MNNINFTKPGLLTQIVRGYPYETICKIIPGRDSVYFVSKSIAQLVSRNDALLLS